MVNLPYSTYLDMPAEVIEYAHRICTRSSISITDLFSAAVALTIKDSAEHLNNNIFINIVRSVRDNNAYDNIIGCFLRLDPVKVNLKTNLNLIELAKSIQHSKIDTEKYQACSGMVKLACLERKFRKKFIKNFIAKVSAKLYCKLFPKLGLNPKVLMMYGRLNSLRTKQQFLINI